MLVKMKRLNGEEVDCEDVDDLNAIEQQRVLHLTLSPLKLKDAELTTKNSLTSPSSFICSSSMVEMMKVTVDTKTMVKEKNAQNLMHTTILKVSSR